MGLVTHRPRNGEVYIRVQLALEKRLKDKATVNKRAHGKSEDLGEGEDRCIGY